MRNMIHCCVVGTFLLLLVGACSTQGTVTDSAGKHDVTVVSDVSAARGNVDIEAGPTPDVCEPVCPDQVCQEDGCGGLCAACNALVAPSGPRCQMAGSPEPPLAMKVEPAFPALVFNRPVQATHAGDGSNRLFVVEKQGRIRVFPNVDDVSVGDTSVFLNITDRVNSSPNEAGLLSVAFHPNYASNRRLFVNYTGQNGGSLTTFVSEFTVSENDPDFVDPSTEVVLMTVAQPFGNHNGGQIGFGLDGYLYVAHGDGGSAGDPYGYSQSLTSDLGKMLRVDVDTASDGLPYGIPPTNPFVGFSAEQAHPEIYAWGLRNAWRFSFDPFTGQLWAADVGQDAWEEVNIVELGKNYGWNIMEGTHCYNAFTCDQEGLEPPVLEYPHSVGQSITGGHVYRGSQFPNLFGAYVYGDYVSGVVLASRFDDNDEIQTTTLASTTLNISAFGRDESGELYVVDYSYFQPSKGRLYRLVEQQQGATTSSFPLNLSETGCFSDVTTLALADGLLPYEVNSPLWHDGARSIRAVSLPIGTQITAQSPGAWKFPVGTRFIKTFVYEQGSGPPVRVETRIMFVEEDGVRGYSYQWNDEQTEATLLSSAGEKTFQVDGQALTWHYPSRSQCKTCHTEAAGGVLGWHTGQLNRDHVVSGITVNQLMAYERLELLTGEVDHGLSYPSPTDPAATTRDKARSILFANCASCHMPGGSPTTDFDLRYETPLHDTGTCDVAPDKGQMGLVDGALIRPGLPEQSLVLLRMETLGPERMPNLGSFVLDTESVATIRDWITDLPHCNVDAATR